MNQISLALASRAGRHGPVELEDSLIILDGPDGDRALVLPSGTTAQRPANPVGGELRFNTTISDAEYWSGVEWKRLGQGIAQVMTFAAFNANGAVGGGDNQVARGSHTHTGEVALSLAVIAAQTGVLGTAVNILLPAGTGGFLTLTYAVTGLPDGLSFDAATRRITGTPTTIQTATVTYSVTDREPRTVSRDFTFTIGSSLALGAVANQSHVAGSTFSLQLPAATGGIGAYTYAATGLPDGLSFDADTRTISGTPTTVESATVTYSVTDKEPRTVSRDFTFAVTQRLALPSVGNRSGRTDQSVNIQLPEATGGKAPYTYSATGLGNGLSFSATNRRITGTPTRATTLNVTYTVTDAVGSTISRKFKIAVSVPPPPPPPPTPSPPGSPSIYWSGRFRQPNHELVFRWGAVAGATSYEVEYGFASSRTNQFSYNSSSRTVVGTSIDLNMYWWYVDRPTMSARARVRAVGAWGKTGWTTYVTATR